MIQSVSFSSAVFGAFAELYLCFLVSASAKKYQGNYNLRNLKKMSGRIKFFFFGKRKSMFCFLKKLFAFQTFFKLDFITQIIYCIIHRCLYSLFILFLFSYISSEETERRNNVNPSYKSKSSTTKWMKKEARGIIAWTLNM